METKIVVGNWKMHKTIAETKEFITSLAKRLGPSRTPVLIAPPFTALSAAAHAAQKTPIVIGAQNMHAADQGAFTGEISGEMVLEAGAKFVILGHSERRRLFYETNDQIASKLKKALQLGLLPILCVGETEEERETGQTAAVLHRQIESALRGIAPQEILLAYEPVWAIGTGNSATAQMAAEAHAECRAATHKVWGEPFARTLPILYGGSVTYESMPALSKESEIGGFLVGGSSLDLDKFVKIIHGVNS